jgi:hypothetical protein
MNSKFDELAKSLAQSVTRRGALKKFGGGLAGMALAAVGLPNEAHATKLRFHCHCGSVNYGCDPNQGNFSDCVFYCGSTRPPRGCAF